MKSKKIIIGNTFPLSMIKREVRIYPISIESLREIIQNSDEVYSYWGHANTIRIAEKFLNVMFQRKDFRKHLSLSLCNKPLWNDIEFKKCFVLSPNYKNGFRPSINKEVTIDEIVSWQALVVEWI